MTDSFEKRVYIEKGWTVQVHPFNYITGIPLSILPLAEKQQEIKLTVT